MATLRMGNRTWVMLNSNRVVQEIIAKRANITGERPYLPITSGLVSRHKRTALRQTKEWSEGRRVMHHLLNGTALKKNEGLQHIESIHLLANYVEQPNEWYLHHYRYAYSVIHHIVVGERPRQTQKRLDDFQRVTVEFFRSINTSLVDFFPVLAESQSFYSLGDSTGRRWFRITSTFLEPGGSLSNMILRKGPRRPRLLRMCFTFQPEIF